MIAFLIQIIQKDHCKPPWGVHPSSCTLHYHPFTIFSIIYSILFLNLFWRIISQFNESCENEASSLGFIIYFALVVNVRHSIKQPGHVIRSLLSCSYLRVSRLEPIAIMEPVPEGDRENRTSSDKEESHCICSRPGHNWVHFKTIFNLLGDNERYAVIYACLFFVFCFSGKSFGWCSIIRLFFCGLNFDFNLKWAQNQMLNEIQITLHLQKY